MTAIETKLLAAAALAALMLTAGCGPEQRAPSQSAQTPGPATVAIDRAVYAAASAQSYSIEQVSTYRMRSLRPGAGGKPLQQVAQVKVTAAYRAPARLWRHTVSESAAETHESWTLADGTLHWEFDTGRQQAIYQRGVETFSSVRTEHYPDLQFDSLSPMTTPVHALLARRKNAERVAYMGRDSIGGTLCDILELTVPVGKKQWESLRKQHPQLPARPVNATHTYYIGVSDGYLHRVVSTSEVPGVSTHWSEDNFTTKAVDPAESFSFARLAAAVESRLPGQRLPRVEQALSESGSALPAIDATRMDGNPLHWDDFRGKVLVVETWASWCAFCKGAMPFYDRMRRQLAEQDVVFLALNFETDEAAYNSWMAENAQRYGFLYARAAVTDENWQEVLKGFKGSLPAFYVVDREGKIVAGYSGFGYGAGKDDPRLLEALRKAGIRI